MKIQVVRKDGSHEILTLTEPVAITRFDGHGGKLKTATGMEHFFNEDGTYDGWSMAVNIPVPEGSGVPQEAMEFIQQIEAGRDFTE